MQPIKLEIGLDVTEDLGIILYEPPIPVQLAGEIKGLFPSFIKKTDEERIQNLTDYIAGWSSRSFHVTEKLDGTSFTAYSYEDFGVCSRNLDLKPTEGNKHWQIARSLELEEKLKGLNLAIQGEIVGEGIQGNPYRLRGQNLYVFNIFDIASYSCLPKDKTIELCQILGLNYVPVIYENRGLGNLNELLELAEGKSVLGDVPREGLVWVSDYPTRVSFKTISNSYLLGEK